MIEEASKQRMWHRHIRAKHRHFKKPTNTLCSSKNSMVAPPDSCDCQCQAAAGIGVHKHVRLE